MAFKIPDRSKIYHTAESRFFDPLRETETEVAGVKNQTGSSRNRSGLKL